MSARRAASPHFGTGQAARIVGVPPHRLRQCVGAGLLRPVRDPRGHLRFGFIDLVLLRTMRGLLDQHVPARQISRVLRSLHRQIGDRALAGLRVYADGRRVVAWDGQSRWQPDSGQFLFNFDAGKVVQGARKVARIAPRPARPAATRLSADEWCDLAMELEDESPLEAKAAYHHALDLDPDHLTARLNLGCLLHAENNLEGAERQYREAIARGGDNALAWYDLGVLLEDRSEPAAALPCYERAIAADAEFADAHYNLALLCESVGRLQDAVRHLAIFRRLSHRRR